MKNLPIKTDVVVRADAFDAELCDLIRQAAIAAGKRSKLYNYDVIKTDGLGIQGLVDEIVQIVAEHYEEDLVEDYSVIFQSREGASMPPHADSEMQEESGEWVPNRTSQRTHVALLYLTTEGVDHEGGILRLVNQNIEIPPHSGWLVHFPADHRYVHEVTEITKGTRYALAVWLKNAEA